MKIICICLARINSKRLPGKLMLDLDGYPLIAYTLKIMNEIGYESYIYTDSPVLAMYTKQNFKKINIEIKPDKYCQDVHLTNQELLEYNQELNADIFIYLPGTSPFRNIETLKQSIKIITANQDIYDCAMTVKKLSDRMYWNKKEFMKAGGLNFNLNKRTFNNSGTFKDNIYEETGNFYIFKKKLLHNIFFINEKCLFIDDPINIDIDTIEDLEKARQYLRSKNGNN
jgi:CMP-N-acetylneuraminic acid synthetase